MINIGMIHGRFQPFHLGHFDYLKSALEYVNELVIGITNPDPVLTSKVNSDSHRHLPDANPFSYFLRLKMIQASILFNEELCDRYKDVMIVPFPVNNPDIWKYYIPMEDTTQIIRIFDPWDEEKKQLFRKSDFDILELDGKRLTSGSEIRKDIFSENGHWQSKVPEGTRKVIKTWLQQCKN